MNFVAPLNSFIALTKPTIVLTYALTGATAMVVERTLLKNWPQFCLVLMAIVLTAAGANGLNQYFEREIDAKMERTRRKRPLPQKALSPKAALAFSLVLCLLSVVIFFRYVNVLSAIISLATILFYSFFYTLWLKPRTHYNIVIGGAAGATAPLIGWAAGSGEISWLAWWMFLIIFTWTPPHFWALALNVSDQYAKVGLPMLPTVKGEERTKKEIWIYSLILVLGSFIPYVIGSLSLLYFFAALFLGIFWLFLAWKVKRTKSQRVAYQFFGYSILYIMVLFISMML